VRIGEKSYVGNIGMTELLVILFIVMIVFGGESSPKLVAALAKPSADSKSSQRETDELGDSSKKKNCPSKNPQSNSIPFLFEISHRGPLGLDLSPLNVVFPFSLRVQLELV